MRIATEQQDHLALVQHLAWRCASGVWWCHIPNGELRHKATAGRVKAMGAKAGAPDLMFVLNGRVLFLELKRGRGGKLSAAQKVVHADIAAAGGEVIVAHGIDEALAMLESRGVLVPEARAPRGPYNKVGHDRQN